MLGQSEYKSKLSSTVNRFKQFLWLSPPPPVAAALQVLAGAELTIYSFHWIR